MAKTPQTADTLAEIKAMCKKILAAVDKENVKTPAPKPATQKGK